MPISQRQRVENALRRAPDGICARFFIYQMSPGIPRVAARINELRTEGFDIRTERCDWPHPDSTTHYMYRLVPDGRLFR